MNALQKEIESWATKAPPTTKIADDYIKCLEIYRDNPNAKTLAIMQRMTATLIIKVLYENGYIPIFENDEIVGYTPKDISELS